ncbi:unnamed protein product, partial [Heligmosomoides polygyrus]|uniref:Uncharacterized protein n=1 Tax=Heligmosomoides polygyrus TaxID=6339 RepID=A0A183GJ49_HELPZ
MSVPPRGVTGNCSLLRAELNTDTRVQEKVREKEAKKAAKKAVAAARPTHYDDVNGKLKSRDGERFVYRRSK